MDVERHRRLQWDIAEMGGKLPFRLSKIRQPDLKRCMETFSNHALSLLQEQIQDAVNYKVEVLHSSFSWKVTRKEICSEKFRIVSRKEPHNNSKLECPCLKTVQEGVGCVRIVAVLLLLGLSVYSACTLLQCCPLETT